MSVIDEDKTLTDQAMIYGLKLERWTVLPTLYPGDPSRVGIYQSQIHYWDGTGWLGSDPISTSYSSTINFTTHGVIILECDNLTAWAYRTFLVCVGANVDQTVIFLVNGKYDNTSAVYSPVRCIHRSNNATSLRMYIDTSAGKMYLLLTGNNTALYGAGGTMIGLSRGTFITVKNELVSLSDARFLTATAYNSVDFYDDIYLRGAQGIWTPQVTCTTGGIASYSNQLGKWHYSGDLVTIRFSLTLTTNSSATTTVAGISNLPFTVNGYPSIVIDVGRLSHGAGPTKTFLQATGLQPYLQLETPHSLGANTSYTLAGHASYFRA